MSSMPSDLMGLRRRLDEIDDRLQDLLIERAEIVGLVAASKKDGNQPAFQPAREAEIIRRLVGRHHGAFPVSTLIRMWREMLAATVRLQSPFSVAVFAPCDRQGCWDLARDHYGSNTPMKPYDTADQVIREMATGEISIGVLPMPESGEPDPWWPQLLASTADMPRVIARLPFGPPGNARIDGGEALVIGRGLHRESGLDRTLFAAECAADVSRARILKLFSALGLVCTLFASAERSGPVELIEIEGFWSISDPRVSEFCTQLGTALRRLVPIGGYAVPLASLGAT